MKALVIFVSIFVVAFLAAEPAIGQQKGSRVPSGPPPWLLPQNQQVEQKKERTRVREKKEVKDSNSTDSNSVADANLMDLPEEVLFELRTEVVRLGSESGGEIRIWMRGEEEEKPELLNSIQEQVTAELKFLQGLAVEEGATKTAGAIEMLLANRQERYEKVEKKLERDVEKLRKKEEKERKKRGSRSRDRTRTDTRRKSPGSPF